MPTGPDDEPTVQDGPGAPDAPGGQPDGFETFLSAVRGMVHGEDEIARAGQEMPDEPDADLVVSPEVPPGQPVEAVAPPSPRDWVAQDEPSEWLPGTWVVDAPTAPRRRADRRMEKSLARQEKKLRDAERRNVRGARKRGRTPADEGAESVEDVAPVGRIPVQPGPDLEGRAEAQGRRRRRQRRQDEARAMAVSNDADSELVPSGPATAIESPEAAADRRGRKGRRRAAGAGGGRSGESGETPTVSGAMSETASMSTLGADPVQDRTGDVGEPTPELGDAGLSRSARRAERRAAKQARRAEVRAAALQQQLAAEAARLERDEQARLAKVEKRERRIDAKVARKAAAAAKRERRAEEAAARKVVEPVVEEPDVVEPAPSDVADQRTRADEKAARAAEKAAEKAARARAREEERAAREAAEAAARAAAERHRLEARLARVETKATARADKDAQRLAGQTAKADAKAMAEAEALDRRQDRRVRGIEKRRTRADAKSAKEIADLERRRERRARRIEKKAARARAKAREESERLAEMRGEIVRLVDVVPPDVIRDRGPADDESLAHYLGRVEASILPWRSRRSRPRVPVRVRRAARIGAVCVLIGGAAVLPWAAPQVAGVIADAVPGGDGHVAAIKDPPVGPRTNAVAGPVGIATETNPLAGKRLAAAGWPRRVQVPRLHVDSTVVPISGQSGSLLPPDDPQVLGWWREGRPVGAEFGSAVITGHTVHTGGGALDNLAKLAVGDTIRTQTDDGWITYVVQRTRIYSTEELARDADDIFRLSGAGRLVMITCDDWNGSFYESNAVVFAAPTSDDPFEGEGVGHVPDPGPGGTS